MSSTKIETARAVLASKAWPAWVAYRLATATPAVGGMWQSWQRTPASLYAERCHSPKVS